MNRTLISSLLSFVFLVWSSHSKLLFASDRADDYQVTASASLHAPNTPANSDSQDVSRSASSGRWSREWLEGNGVTFEVGYRAEVFTNLRGGLDVKRGSTYLGSADTSVTVDLGKLRLGRGAVVVTGQSLHGRGINDSKIGAMQAPSNLDSSRFNKLIEAYYTDSIHHRFNIKVGRLYADSDFGAVENGSDFLNSSYGLIPTIPMPTYPAPQLGASVWAKATPWLSVGAGVYRGAEMSPSNATAAPLSTGLFTVVETKLEPLPPSFPFHGTYRVGVWQQGGSSWVASNPDFPVRNYGVYATGDHWFRKASSAGENFGPGVFFQLGWNPSDRNEVREFVGGGVACPAMVPKRQHDTFGVGLTQARLSTGNSETAVELFYKTKAIKKIYVQPDLQWINRPAGDGRNALVAGLRVGLEF